MLAVMTYKNSRLVWQVIDPKNNCAIVQDDLESVAAAIHIRDQLLTQKKTA